MLKQRTLFDDLLDADEEGIPNPFYDPDGQEAYSEYAKKWEAEANKREAQRQAKLENSASKICCAHVSKVDGSAYAVKVYDAEPETPHYVIYPDGLPEGVEPKRCDCNGECAGWRGGELINRLYDRGEEIQS